VHEHDPDPDLVEDSDLFHEGARAARVREYFAADLQYENFALEQAYVRRRMLQRRDDGRPIVPLLHDPEPSI
jgi:hypothetical protein